MTARLVAVGRKYPEAGTVHVQYATSDPAWESQRSLDEHLGEPDPSDYRKQQEEERIAWGDHDLI